MTTTSTSTRDAFGLVVRFVLKAGREREFDDLTAATVAEIRRREPGTVLYLCHSVEGAPNERIFYELYRDRAAFEAHEEQPHVRTFLASRGQLVERFEVDFLAPTVHAGSVGE